MNRQLDGFGRKDVLLIGRFNSSRAESGIRNVPVTLTQADGATRTVLTANSGYFTFDDVLVGQIAIINVRSKRFTFIQPTLILNVSENSNEINFVANE